MTTTETKHSGGKLKPASVVLDALETRPRGQQADIEAAETTLASANHLPWEQVETVGEGSDFRAEGDNIVASALSLDGSLIHASISAAM